MPLIEVSVLADVPQLVQLVNGAYRGDTAKKGWTTEADLLDGSRVDADLLIDYINDDKSTILKYVDDNEIKACVLLTLNERDLYLGMLTVSPLLQNKGIGKVLLNEAQSYARQWHRDKITITVIDLRAELIAWYERYGFKKTGEYRPFPTETKFGIQKVPFQLLVMEKYVL